MGRGLGTMQREVLAVAQAMAATPREVEIGIRGYFTLPVGIVCMRQVSQAVMRRHGERFIEGTVQASYARAVRSLLRRGLLERVGVVPVANHRDVAVHRLCDGDYLLPRGRRALYCKVPLDSAIFHNTYEVA
ncbi:MAG TPA: hypothetical protein VLM89_11905 [Phycisphaerae bacterium]|nr:hypothetical protein [Phycisphaerae bacterium]